MRLLPIVTIAALLLAFHDASAQRYPGRDRSGSPREESARGREGRPNAAPVAADPYSALERELISLKVDIGLKPNQVDAWNLFERDVRVVAELDRAQRRRLIALRDASSPAPTALSVVGSLADDERLKADSVADLKRHLQALHDLLDENQRRMLDRRVVQSQTEPLGQ
jgi:hypothetical protein